MSVVISAAASAVAPVAAPAAASAVASGYSPGARPATLQDHERQRCEVWTRVMGYHRPVSEFNPGKQGEHGERRHFVEQGG